MAALVPPSLFLVKERLVFGRDISPLFLAKFLKYSVLTKNMWMGVLSAGQNPHLRIEKGFRSSGDSPFGWSGYGWWALIATMYR